MTRDIRDLSEHIHISLNEAIDEYRSHLGDKLRLIVDEVVAPLDAYSDYSMQTGFKVVGSNSIVAYLTANETSCRSNLFIVNERFKLFADLLRQRLQSSKVFTYGGGFSFPKFEEKYVQDIDVKGYIVESKGLSSSSSTYLSNLDNHSLKKR